MKKLMLLIMVILCGCGGSDKSISALPHSGADPQTPAISGLTIYPAETKANTGYPWSGENWPQYGCTKTIDLVFNFNCVDNADDLKIVTITWIDSLGKLSGTRTGAFSFRYSPHEPLNPAIIFTISHEYIAIIFTISHEYIEPFMGASPDYGAGQANCSDSVRTYTYYIYVTDKAGNKSNTVSTTWVVTP